MEHNAIKHLALRKASLPPIAMPLKCGEIVNAAADVSPLKNSKFFLGENSVMKPPFVSSVTDQSKFRIDTSTNTGVSPFVMPTATQPVPSPEPLQHTVNHIACPA